MNAKTDHEILYEFAESIGITVLTYKEMQDLKNSLSYQLYVFKIRSFELRQAISEVFKSTAKKMRGWLKK